MPEHFIDFQTPRYISYTRPNDDVKRITEKKVVKEGYKKRLSVYREELKLRHRISR